MTEATAITVTTAGQIITAEEWSETRLGVLHRELCPDLNPDQFALFVAVCKAKRLDPFARQIHAIVRKSKKKRQEANGKWVEFYDSKMSIQTGIDGFRTIAERTGKYRGQRGPFWCGPDGVWKDVWLLPAFPAAAKVEVLRDGWDTPLVGIALWREYVQEYEGRPQALWGGKPTVMIAKCAEAIALRRAFPEELSGLYTNDEVDFEDRQERDRAVELEATRALVHSLPPPKTAPVPTSADSQVHASPPTVTTDAASTSTSAATPVPSSQAASGTATSAAAAAPSSASTDTPSPSSPAPSSESGTPATASPSTTAASAPSTATKPKRSTTVTLREFRDVIGKCTDDKILVETLASWRTTLEKLPQRARAMAEALARVRFADFKGEAHDAKDDELATQLNEMFKE